MAKLLFTAIIVLCVQRISTQRPANRKLQSSAGDTARTLDPVSKILSDLSDFVLDVDEAVARQLVPKENFVENTKEYARRRSSGTNFFDRVRENYKNLQDRLGLSLGAPDDLSVSSDLFDVNIKNKGEVIDVSLPLSPIKVVARSNSPFLSSSFHSKDLSETKNEALHPDIDKEMHAASRFTGKTKLEGAEIDASSSSDASLDSDKLQKRSSGSQKQVSISPMIEESDEFTPDELPTSTPYMQEHFSTQKIEFDERIPEDPDTSGLRGRILGDILYSESTFDKIMKRLIRDYGSLVLDSDLAPSKIFNRLSKVTKNIFRNDEPTAAESEMKVREDENVLTTPINLIAGEDGIRTNKFLQNNLPRQIKSPRKIWDNVIEREEKHAEKTEYSEDLEPFKNLWKFPPKTMDMKQKGKRILLAFTQQGIPLKLKVPSELENPLGFLHRILKTAGVSLNFPVESYRNIEPSGTAVLQLGVGKNKMNVRTMNVDLTDMEQLDSFLRILRTFKTD